MPKLLSWRCTGRWATWRSMMTALPSRGLLVRHLVLPAGAAGTAEVVRFLSREVSGNTYLNVMAQYRPEYKACGYSKIDRSLTAQEYREAVRMAADAGLTRGLDIY